MRPFSAFKYVSGNRGRSAVIAVMMACITVCFVAGMYIDHPYETFAVIFDRPSDYAWLSPNGNSLEVYDEFHEFRENIDDYTPDCAETVMPATMLNIMFKSILGFDNMVPMPFFADTEDYSEFVRVTGAVPSDIVLEDGELVMSQTLADNWGVKVGDVLQYEDDVWTKAAFGSPMTVKAVVDIPGTVIYGVCSEYNTNTILVLRGEPSSAAGFESRTVDEALGSMRQKINADYPHVKVYTNGIYLGEVTEELSMMNLILVTITILVGVVLAVTVNAAFSAAFDKRKYEYSIYKAIGFTNRQIFGKVFSEVMLLNVIGLVAGMILCTASILILNYLLRPSGIYFFKISLNGLAAVLACDLIVVVPAVLLNMKRVRKYDVTVY